jgi:hypothetical protein
MPMTRSRRWLSLLVAVIVLAAMATAVASSGAAAPVASAAKAKPKHHPRRLGGKVRRAWPAGHTRRPKTALARWLARQVGPRKPLPCSKRPKRARARCAARRRHKGHASAATAAAPVATAASAAKPGSSEQIRIARTSATRSRSLQLIRSFDIPSDDPSYDRLLNWSWTYDSAVSAIGFASVGAQGQSGRLLDQLAALQRKDGSLEFAFDTRTGQSSKQIRAGSIAMAGIAWVEYTDEFGNARYLDNAKLAADYLLALRNGHGLVRGGPDVKWVSTQHNLFTAIFLSGLSQRLDNAGDSDGAARYKAAAQDINRGIESQLIVRDDDGPVHFRQGVNDNIIPLDTQTFGAIWLAMSGDEDTAKQVYEFAQKNFQVDGRSIKLSKRPATYNMTYQAKGPFTGYRPYLGRGAPDVLWFEGTAEMRFVSSHLGDDTSQLDESMKAWWSITSGEGLAPLGADRTVTRSKYNEYHVWPTAAAGAWALISGVSHNADWADPATR